MRRRNDVERVFGASLKEVRVERSMEYDGRLKKITTVFVGS